MMKKLLRSFAVNSEISEENFHQTKFKSKTRNKHYSYSLVCRAFKPTARNYVDQNVCWKVRELENKLQK